MIDVFLIIFIIAFLLITLAVNIRLLFYFQQEGTGFTEHIAAKTVVILSLTVAWFMVLFLPLDVRNAQALPTDLVLDMRLAWVILYILAAIFIFIVIPVAMFWHEVEDDDEVKQKWKPILFHWGISMLIVTAIIVITYFIFNTAHLPIVEYECPFKGKCTAKGVNTTIAVGVRFDIYLIAFLSFIGWMAFVTFGGIGLSALPIGVIFDFIDRPKPIDITTYAEKKRLYGETATALLEKANELEEKDRELSTKKGFKATREKRSLKNEFNKFKQTAYLLECEYEKVEVAMKMRGENPIVSYVKLIGAFFLAIASLMWMLHVIIYVLIGQKSHFTGFLNDILIGVQGAEPGTRGPAFIIAILIFSFLNIHILLCVMNGTIRVGMKLFCLPIHPMRAAKTPLNSFLFNCMIILLSACAITQFSQQCFADYSRTSSLAVIFQGPVRYMAFYKFFNDNLIFYYLFVIWGFVAAIGMVIKPRDVAGLNLDGKAEKAFSKAMGKVKKQVVKSAIKG